MTWLGRLKENVSVNFGLFIKFLGVHFKQSYINIGDFMKQISQGGANAARLMSEP